MLLCFLCISCHSHRNHRSPSPTIIPTILAERPATAAHRARQRQHDVAGRDPGRRRRAQPADRHRVPQAGGRGLGNPASTAQPRLLFVFAGFQKGN